MRPKRMMVAAGLFSLVAAGTLGRSWTHEAAHYVEDHYDVPLVHDCHGLRPHHEECR
jgi:hypothetical protein